MFFFRIMLYICAKFRRVPSRLSNIHSSIEKFLIYNISEFLLSKWQYKLWNATYKKKNITKFDIFSSSNIIRIPK